MRIRLNTKWNNQQREVSLEETVSVLAFNAWKIGMKALLEIENEHFQTDTQMQRLAIMQELMAFLIHMLDRMAHEVLNAEDRNTLINTYALKLADYVQDNARDFAGKGDYRSPFIDKLNDRLDTYAQTTWNAIAQEPGFSMSLTFAATISESLGPRDKQWALDYIQRVLMPELLAPYKRVIARLGLVENR